MIAVLLGMSTLAVVLVVLIVLAIASVPLGMQRGWGPYPGGGVLGLIVLVLLVLYLTGHRF